MGFGECVLRWNIGFQRLITPHTTQGVILSGRTVTVG